MGPDLVDVFDETLTDGAADRSFNEDAGVLLHKKGVREELKN